MIKCQQDLVANWKSTSACPTPVWTAACAKTWPVVTHVTVPLDSQGTAVRSTLMSVTALPAWMEARAWMLWTVSGNKRPDGKQEWWYLLLEINSAGKSTHFWWDVLYLRDEVDTDRMWSVFKVKVPSCAVSYCAALCLKCTRLSSSSVSDVSVWRVTEAGCVRWMWMSVIRTPV